MTKTYYSKVSYRLLAFVFVVFLGPIVSSIITNGLNLKMMLLQLCLIVVFGFIVHMFLKTTYTIINGTLKIKCGFFSYKPIAINTITKIAKTNSVISSPAASFDRVEIKYGTFDTIIISPKNKVNFALDLTMLNPSIENNIK